VPCERAAPHLLQQAVAALPSHRSCAGSPSRPLGRALQAGARQGRAQPARPPSVLSPASEAAECCQRAPTRRGSRRADIRKPSSAAALAMPVQRSVQ